MAQAYNDPIGGTASTIGTQIRTDYYQKKALIEKRKEIVFGPLADVTYMPKHMGKTIRAYHYLPILDDANINDQGIDASGATTTMEHTITLTGPNSAGEAGKGLPLYFVGNHASVEATAITAAKTAFIAWIKANFPAVYDSMPHTTVAGDYALQEATTTVKEVNTISLATITTGDVYNVTYGGLTLSFTVAGTETVNAVLAGLQAATGYGTLPFTLAAGATATTDTGTIVATWTAAGFVSPSIPITVSKTGTGTISIARTTVGMFTVYDLGYRFAVVTVNGSGNLHGSSKDIGYIADRLPAITEHGGRVNRVGHKRIQLEGTLEKYGFFDEYTQESLDFDTDDQLQMHINREMINAAYEVVEDLLQIDLLSSAGVLRYGGAAMSNAQMTGNDGEVISELSYDDFSRMDIILNNNRCPKQTKIISGSRMIDTKVINAARIAYIGSELQPTIERMKDYFDNPAFIPVAKYASAATPLTHEIGAVGSFRIVVVPEMLHWAGVGATEVTNKGYRVTNGKYDVFPILIVGSESFTTIGFETHGKNKKFTIFHKAPGKEQATTTDPYGEKGFMSIKWYYGFMPLRPERIAVMKSVARM